MKQDTDVLVIGSGIAGLSFALRAAERGDVLIVTKKEKATSSTNHARGGIAAGIGPDDDPALHLEDTLAAGAGLCHEERVELLVREGPARVRELIEWGVRFHDENGRLSLGMEGGHSRRRVVHAGDRTGREIERALLAAVAGNPRIQVIEHLFAVDFLVEEAGSESGPRCSGLETLDGQTGMRTRLHAPVTFLATGGCGQVYQHTTNPAIATGDGIAMAYRAGATVANMEFIQFHPTALYPTENPAFLLSEAIRGEGAVLVRMDGSTFMEEHDPRGSLASRDVVARAIHIELARSGDPHVLLDLSAIPREMVERRFPGAVEGCLERGIDLFSSGIPVVPAAHYVCGGVTTDACGRTSIPGLYAAGEVACTGVHGANRLASNSLLEAVVFTYRAAEGVAAELDARRLRAAAPVPESEQGEEGDERRPDRASPGEVERVRSIHRRLGELMWKGAGIVRSDDGLAETAGAVAALVAEEEARWRAAPCVEGAELRNLLQTAELIVRCARARRESRGLHYNVDHPAAEAGFLHDTVIP